MGIGKWGSRPAWDTGVAASAFHPHFPNLEPNFIHYGHDYLQPLTANALGLLG